MATEKKVVDASVIVKWFLNEPDSDKAIEIREEHLSGKTLIIIPELAFIEVINALRYKGNNILALSKAIKSLWDIQLKVERLNPFLIYKAAEISLKNDLSIYDGVYSALATIFGISLLTADEKMLKAPNAIRL